MALQVCTKCGTAYAPAGQCPHCGDNHWVDEQEAEQLGLFQRLNEGDHPSVSPDNPLGIEVKTGDSQEPEDGPDVADVAATEPEASAPDEGAQDDKGEPTATPVAVKDNPDVRTWAAGQGIDLADDAPVPDWVVAQFREQNSK